MTIGKKALTDRQRDLLKVITVGPDNIARFPKEPRIPDWPALKKVMVALGGTWKASDGFRFPVDVDADELVHQARTTGSIVDPRSADFFETPGELGDEVACELGHPDRSIVLEPSAGKGALVRALKRARKNVVVVAVEALAANCDALEAEADKVHRGDFLELVASDLGGKFSHIAMNPPFSRRQDIAHVQHAYELLKPGGTLAAIMSGGVEFRDDRLGNEFRSFVNAHGSMRRLPDGSFKASGTLVRTVLVKIRRGE